MPTDPRLAADQAGMVAAAWSRADAPASWALTAAQFEALRDDPELVALAATISPDRLPPLLFTAADRRARRFRSLVEEVGAARDLDWISLDPLVPMGDATDSVIGIPAPRAVLERQRRGAVFGALARVSYRGGERSRSVLGFAHPGAGGIEWL